MPIIPRSIDDLVSLQPAVLRRRYPLPYIVWSRQNDGDGVRPWMTLNQVLNVTARDELRAEPINGSGSPLFTGTRADTVAIRPFKGPSQYYLDHSHKARQQIVRRFIG